MQQSCTSYTWIDVVFHDEIKQAKCPSEILTWATYLEGLIQDPFCTLALCEVQKGIQRWNESLKFKGNNWTKGTFGFYAWLNDINLKLRIQHGTCVFCCVTVHVFFADCHTASLVRSGWWPNAGDAHFAVSPKSNFGLSQNMFLRGHE